MAIRYTAISHVLLDIEGTTCPVSFVADTLFPYALQHLQEFVERHHQEPAIQDLLRQLADHQRNASPPTSRPTPAAQSLFLTTESIPPTHAPGPEGSALDPADFAASPNSSVTDVRKAPNRAEATSDNEDPAIVAAPQQNDGCDGSRLPLPSVAPRPVSTTPGSHAQPDGKCVGDDSSLQNGTSLPNGSSFPPGNSHRGESSFAHNGTAVTMAALPALVAYAKMLIQSDLKFTPLKDLQGRIWSDGYAKGELIAPLFADVPPCLKEWSQQGMVLAVYSSGSVAAQKLLYRFSNAGDITGLFQHWFDTHLGHKQTPSSYCTICEQMGAHPNQVLFISDSPAELEAAQTAGLEVLSSERPGNPHPTSSSTFPAIQDFHGLKFR